MKRYLWCTPVLPGKRVEIMERWTETTLNFADPKNLAQAEEMHNRCGLCDFNLWIQHTSEGALAVFYWEMENWGHFWNEYRSMVAEGSPRAVTFQDQALSCLGIDLAEEGAVQEPETLSLNELGKLPANEVICVAQAWPVLEGGEERRRSLSPSLCGRLGIICETSALARSGESAYFLSYHEVDQRRWIDYIEFMSGSRLDLSFQIDWVLDRAPVSLTK